VFVEEALEWGGGQNLLLGSVSDLSPIAGSYEEGKGIMRGLVYFSGAHEL